MYCKYCGNPVDRSTMSCSACGKPVGPLAGGVGLRDLLSGGGRAAADNVIPASQTPLAPAAPSPEVKRELARLSAELQEVRESIPQKKSGVSPILTGLCAAALLLSLVSLIVAVSSSKDELRIRNLEEQVELLRQQRYAEQEATPALEETPHVDISAGDENPKAVVEQQEVDEPPQEPSQVSMPEQTPEAEEAEMPTPTPIPTPDTIFIKHPGTDAAPTKLGAPAIFTCTAQGEGIQYFWEFSNDPAGNNWTQLTNNAPYSITFSNGQSVLTISPTQDTNIGYYRCRVIDSAGIEHISEMAKLRLEGYPDPDDHISANAVAGGAEENASAGGSLADELFPKN